MSTEVKYETKSVVKEIIYRCDLSSKTSKNFDDIAYSFPNPFNKTRDVIILKEAYNLLPVAVQEDKELLRAIIMGCGSEINKFEPQMLHQGVWVVTLMKNAYNWNVYSQITNIPAFPSNYGFYSLNGNKNYGRVFSTEHEDRFVSIFEANSFVCAHLDKHKDINLQYIILNGGKVHKIMSVDISLVNETSIK